MECDFEKSCAKFAIVFTLIFPTLLAIALLIVIIVMAVQKKPKEDYLFYVYYLVGLIISIGTARFLYQGYPGIFCGFFIVFVTSLLIQPIVNFGVFEKKD